MLDRKNTLELLKQLSEANGVPAREQQVRQLMEQEFLKTVSKEDLVFDKLGSIGAKLVGTDDADAPRIIVAGHMDEIGMIVTKITDEGCLRFQTVGGWWSQVMLSQQMNITTSNGKVLRGVIGSKPPHILTPDELKNPANIDEMFIDLGVKNKDEAIALGIKIGDMITPAIDFQPMANPNYLLGKAWDNRAGCAVAIQVLEALKNEKHENIVYGVGTVQEEVGLRGAKTMGNLIKPDIVFALDVGIAKDIPGTDKTVKLGDGPGLFIYDSSMVGHVGLREKVMEIADELNIPYQLDYLKRGGTDAGNMHLAHDGAPAMAVCIPTRYIHSHTSIMHLEDYENTVKLLVEIIKRLDKDTVRKITYE